MNPYNQSKQNSGGKNLAWLIVVAFAAVFFVPAMQAATDTWTGASVSSANWSDAQNWSPAATPNTNDTLIFDGVTQLNNTNNLTANAPLGGLTFATTAGSFVLNGNAIAPSNTPAVTIADNATVPEVINLNLAPPTNIVFSVVSGGSLTNNGVLSGLRNVSQTGPGTLVFTATNTFTGPISGIAGTLAIGGAGLLGGGFYTNSSARITNNGTFVYSSSANQTLGKTINSTINGTMSGTGALVVNGPGTLTLSASNTYTGGTTVNGGVLALNFNGPTNNDNGLPTIVGTLTINPGARVNTLLTDAIGYGVGAAPQLNTVNIIGGTFNKNVAGNESYTTTFNLTAGIISSTGGGGINMNTNFNFNTFATNVASTVSAPVVMRGPILTYTVAAGTVPNGIDLLASGANSNGGGGGGVLAKVGAGTMAMSGVNTFNGGLVVSNGTLLVNGSGSLNSGNFGGFINNLTAINFNSTAAQTLSGAITNAGTIAFSNAAADTLAGTVSGTGTITQNGSGSLVISGAAAHTGATTINAGELIGVTGGIISNSVVTIATGATNGIQLTGVGGQFTTTNLIFNSGTTYLDLNLANNALSASSAPLNVNGSLTIGGTLNIIFRNPSGIVPGDYPLIKYASLSGSLPVALTLPAGITAVISNNVANQSIDLVVSVGNQVTWAAGSGTWDFSTPNWHSGASTVDYADGNFAIFEDTQSGASPITVTLNTTVNPGSVTVNNTAKTYAISGSGAIAGAASLIKEGTNNLTLVNNNTYTNVTALNSGTTILDYTGGATSIISSNSPLSFGGGTLNVNGINSGVSTQSFAGTTIITDGGGVINAASATPGTTLPVVALGALNYSAGGTMVFNGPTTSTGLSSSSGQQGALGNGDQTGVVTATASITITNGANNSVIIGPSTGTTYNAPYATVGLYDFAGTANASAPYIVTGISQLSGGSAGSGLYTLQNGGTLGNNAGVIYDIVGSVTTHNTTSALGLRFNAPGGNVSSTTVCTTEGILNTPNVGANNSIVSATGANGWAPGLRSAFGGSMIIWQNNILGYLSISSPLFDDSGKPAGSYVQAGPGTVSYTGANAYTGQTYLNGGVSLYIANTGLGAPGTGAQVFLNGGTVLAAASFTLDNSGANKRPISLGFNGGGLAVISGKILTVDGVISGVVGTGPLWVGIPASSANFNVLGVVPGTGSSTANTTATNATGTVNLTAANTYAGGTILYSGTLNFTPGSIGSGGVTLAGGTLQWAVGNTTDISANTVGIVSPGGTLDVNGNTVTLANSIGAGGSGALTLFSSAPNGVLNLNGANTFTGGTLISNNTLVNLNNSTGSATGSGAVTLQGINAAIIGGGRIGGNLTVSSGTSVSPGNGVGALTVGGSLTINSGSVFNYEFNATPTNDLIVAGGLTINDTLHNAVFNLYQAGGTSPLGVGGTYNLIKYSGSIGGGSGLDSSWTTVSSVNPHVGNPQVGSTYSFGTSGGYLTLTVAVDPTVTIAAWNVDANGNWSDATKWSSNPKVPGSPGPGDSPTFGVGSAFRSVTNDAPESVGGIKFTNNNSFQIVAGAGTLTLNNKGNQAPIYVTGGTSNNIQTAVGLSDNTTLNASSGATLAISGNINNTSASKTLTVNGLGTVALTGNNSYGPAPASGFGTTLASGTLQIGNNNALGAGDIAVTGNSTVAAIASLSGVPNNVDIAPAVTATVTNTAANNLTLAGVISDSGALVKSGGGILTLNPSSGANTYAGGTTVNGGSISISADADLGTVTTLVLNNGGLLANATASLDPSRNLALGLASGNAASTNLLDAAGSQILTVPGVIASAGNLGANSLTVNSLSGSSGTVLLSGVNTFNGTTVISNGTLQVANSLALQGSTLSYNGAGSLVFDPGITAATLGALSGTNNLSMTNLSSSPIVPLTVGGNNASTAYSGSLNDGGAGASLVKNGSGTFTLKGTNNSYLGTTIVNAGTLEITNPAMLNSGLLGGQGFLVDGGTLNVSAGTSSFGAAGNAFSETSGSVTADTFQSSQNDGTLFSLTGGTLSLNNMILRRTGSNPTAPTPTVPQPAQQNNGFFMNGTNAIANLGGLTIGNNNSSCSVYLGAGVLTVTNAIFVGIQTATAGRFDILQVNGGLLNSLDTVNGIVIAPSASGNNNSGEVYLSGGTTLAQLIAFGAAADTIAGNGFLIVTNASLYVGGGGIIQPSPTAYTSTISFLNNSILGAITSWTNNVSMQLNGNVNIKAADTNGVAQNITLAGAVSGANPLNKTGAGVLTLAGTNTYTGNTIVSNGTVALTGNGSIAASTNINVFPGAVFDVSAISYTLGGSQSLLGSGTNNGVVNTTSGSRIYAGTDGIYGTNTFNNDLVLAVGATANLDLGTNFSGTNDLIKVGGNLKLNGNTMHLKAPSTLVGLDTNGDYVLFNVAGTISGSFVSAPVWDVQPTNSARFAIVTDAVNKKVLLHAYQGTFTPPTGIGSATPSSIYGNQTVLLTVAATPGTNGVVANTITSVVVDASAIGGSSTLTLVLSNTVAGISYYTNSVTLPNFPSTIGSITLVATITDSFPSVGAASFVVNVQAGRFWVGGAAPDNTWVNGLNWLGGTAPIAANGESLTFGGVIQTTPNMEQSYNITNLNFDSTAGNFNLTNDPTTLNALTINGNIANNSTNSQTINIPLVFNGARTINAPSGNIIINSSIVDDSALGTLGAFIKTGAGTLTLTSSNNTFSGGTTVSGGTLALPMPNSGGTDTAQNHRMVISSGATLLLADPNALAGKALNMGTANLQLRSDSDNAFVIGGAFTETSANSILGIDVNTNLTGATGHTLSLPALTFTSSSDQTVNITGNSTYTMGLGDLTLTTGSHTPVFNLFLNASPTGPLVTISSVTCGNWDNSLDFNGGGKVTVTGNLIATSNGSIDLFVNNGTTATLHGISTGKNGASDGKKNDVVNGTLVLDNDNALINDTVGTGLTQSLFVLGAATNIFSGTGYNQEASALTATNNNFNAAVYLGYDTGGNNITTPANLTNNVSDGDVGFTNSGVFTIGGLNTNGVNVYANPIILGWTANRGKSVTLVAANGGEVDFTGGILANGNNRTAGVTIGNGTNNAGLISFQTVNTYGGGTTISNGMLALSGSGSIDSSASLNIAAGATFDVSALGSYALSTNKTLIAGGTTIAATINGYSGESISLAGQPIVLNYDGSDSALSISNGAILTLGTNAFTVNTTNSLPLANGSYTIAQAGGGIVDGGHYPFVVGTAIGAGHAGSIAITGGINVTLTVVPSALASFIGGPTNGVAPLSVVFKNLSSLATSYLWNFGNGSTLATSSGTNVSTIYTNAGSYTVGLTAYGAVGTNTLTISNYIVVIQPPPVAGVTNITPAVGLAPLSVTFSNLSSGATNYLWSFGDSGTLTTSGITNVTHSYTNAGIYTNILTAYGVGGTNAATNLNSIVVSAPAPVAAFGGSPTNIFVTQTVVFTNTSTGSITNWVWNFGDGVVVTNATGVSVNHVYNTTNTAGYTVSLIVTGSGGANTNTRANYIGVVSKVAIAQPILSGGNLIFGGTGGPVGQPYRILSTTNVALPVLNWTPVYTNVFLPPNGSYAYTNTPLTNAQNFFRLVSP